MDIEGAIMKMGLVSRTQNIVVALNGQSKQKLGGQLQTDVGLVYGWNIYADTVDPDGDDLISTTDATNLYLTLKIGGQDAVETIRLDDMLSVFAGSPVGRAKEYLELIIPYWALSLDKSNIKNPTLVGSDGSLPVVYINMRYLSMDDYQELCERGPDYGIAIPATIQPIKDSIVSTVVGGVIPQVAGKRRGKKATE